MLCLAHRRERAVEAAGNRREEPPGLHAGELLLGMDEDRIGRGEAGIEPTEAGEERGTEPCGVDIDDRFEAQSRGGYFTTHR